MPRSAIAIGLVLALTTAAVLVVLAQDPAPVAGTLYLTNEKLRTQTATDCTTPTYALNMTNGSLRKTYVGRSTLATACASVFEFNVTHETRLQGNVSASLLLGCDATTVLRTGSPSLPTLKADLQKNAVVLSSAQGSAPSPTCSPANRILFELVIPNKISVFKTGDRIGLRVTVWALTGDESLAKNVHLVVGGPNASAIRAVGLPSKDAPAGLGSAATGAANGTANSSGTHSASGTASAANAGTTTATVTTTETATVTTTPSESATTTVTVSATGSAEPNASACPSPCTLSSTNASNGTPAAASATFPSVSQESARPAAVSAAQRPGGRSPGAEVLFVVAAMAAAAVVLAVRRRAN